MHQSNATNSSDTSIHSSNQNPRRSFVSNSTNTPCGMRLQCSGFLLVFFLVCVCVFMCVFMCVSFSLLLPKVFFSCGDIDQKNCTIVCREHTKQSNTKQYKATRFSFDTQQHHDSIDGSRNSDDDALGRRPSGSLCSFAESSGTRIVVVLFVVEYSIVVVVVVVVALCASRCVGSSLEWRTMGESTLVSL